MKPFDWRRDGIVLAIAMLAPSFFTWLYFIAYAGQGHITQALYLGSKVLLGLLPIWWYFQTRTDLTLRATLHLLWKKRSDSRISRSILAGTLFGILTMLAILVFYEYLLNGSSALAGTDSALQSKLTDAGVTSVWSYLGLAVFLSVLHSAFEEYYWRWFVFGRLREGVSWVAAATVASLAFALHHVIVLSVYIPATHVWLIAVLSLGIALGGFVWSAVYQKTGSLLGAWIAHFMADAGIMWCGYFVCKGYLA
jgi:membrane protease YdiL (CAAX protease family)